MRRAGHRDLRRLISRLSSRMFPRVPDFHAFIGEQCHLAVRALEALADFSETGDPEHGERVRALEKEGDRLRLRNLDVLDRAFATPIDRGAIIRAVVRIDDVVNYAKTTVREVDILDVPPDDHVRAMARELLAGGRALRDGFLHLRDDPASAAAAAAAVHKAERNVEKAYRLAVAELFSRDERDALLRSGDPEALGEAFARLLDGLRRREVYRHLSNAADRLDGAGRALQDIAVGDV